MIDGTHASGNVAINDNFIHDGACGDGIDIRLRGTADIGAEIDRNVITRLPQGHFQAARPSVEVDSLMAIGLQTDDVARLVVDEVGNSETYNGGAGSDADALFYDVSGASTMIARLNHNTFAHGVGGTSCNGLELITGYGNSSADLTITNSTFDDNPGDMIEAASLGNGSKVRLALDNVTVRNTTIRGGTGGAIPFNIGECLLAGNAGSDEVFTLEVRNSEFAGCNNGISLLSNGSGENGVSPVESISADIAGSKIHDNQYYNLWVQNFTPLRNLTVGVEDTEISNAGQTGVAIDAKPTGATLNAIVDLGSGALGSEGNNCIFGSAAYDAETTGYEVAAKNNWWGSAGGPAAGKTSATPPILAGLDYEPVLSAPPAAFQ
jgi:hypothetical protein